MNIRTAYSVLTQKEFVDWALENNYPYFIAIEEIPNIDLIIK